MQKQKKPTIMETVISLGTMLVVLIGAFTIRYAIYRTYNEKALLSDENRKHLRRFIIEASNAGVKSAHGYAAIYYLDDLEEATRRYEMMIDGADKLSAHKAHQLIDFVNYAYMTGKKPTERMERFVKMVKDQGFCIEVTPDGVVWNKK